jgi:hypothetical protein
MRRSSHPASRQTRVRPESQFGSPYGCLDPVDGSSRWRSNLLRRRNLRPSRLRSVFPADCLALRLLEGHLADCLSLPHKEYRRGLARTGGCTRGSSIWSDFSKAAVSLNLRTVIVTAAVHRGFSSSLSALPLTFRHWAGVSPYT